MIAVWGTSTSTTFTGNIWANQDQQLYGVLYGD
jgi:hypothetical protein